MDPGSAENTQPLVLSFVLLMCHFSDCLFWSDSVSLATNPQCVGETCLNEMPKVFSQHDINALNVLV